MTSVLFFLFLGLPLLAIFNAWLGFPFFHNILNDYNAISGVLPYSDAQGYYDSMCHFIHTGAFKEISIRRPFFTLWGALLLRLTEDFRWIMVIMSCVSIGATFLMSTMIFPLSSRLCFIIPASFFASIFSVILYSELFGYCVGALSFVLIYNAYHSHNTIEYVLGLFCLTIGIISRSGPVFIIPGLILLILLYPLRPDKKFLDTLLCLSVVILAYWLGQEVSLLFSNGDSAFQANFSYTLYGLVNGGTGWKEASLLPELQGLNERHQAALLYQMSWDLFKEKPYLLAVGLLSGVAQCIKWFFSILVTGPYGWVRHIMRLFSVVAVSYGLWRVWKNRSSIGRDLHLLVVFAVSGLLSAAVVWADGQFRVFATVVPFFCLLMVYMFSPHEGPIARSQSTKKLRLVVCLGLISFLLLPLIQVFMPIKEMGASEKDGFVIISHLNQYPHVHIGQENGFFARSNDQMIKDLRQDPCVEEVIKKACLSMSNFTLAVIYHIPSKRARYVLLEGEPLQKDAVCSIVEDGELLHLKVSPHLTPATQPR